MVKVRIPTPLRPLTGGKSEVAAPASDIQSLIDSLNGQFPGLKDRVCDDKGEIRRFVNIYLNEEDIRFLKGKHTPLKDGDEVSIVPAIAGGTFPGRGPRLGTRGTPCSVNARGRSGGCEGRR
ncbi:MAG TPA: MoaD/ThiS family protein [Nitrospirales bacterium]|nr:MoaD/ThiS family protein [Nitrospirales bacterium]